jgi:hypothetical protein
MRALKLSNHRFKFQKRSQLCVRSHNEPLSVVAMRVRNVRPLESTAETQPQLQPALLRLSAMISQYFTPTGDFKAWQFLISITSPFQLKA